MDRKFDGRVPVWQSAVFYICCLLFGVTFIFSGFVKAIDPLGTVYKIEDYLVAMHLDALNPLSGVAAFALFSLEFLTGMLILLNIRFREGLILGTAFMAVMTPLTLWIALENPVTDCGCFGDALGLPPRSSPLGLDSALLALAGSLPAHTGKRRLLQPALPAVQGLPSVSHRRKH